jgi:predicted acetyltransferase
MSRETIELVWPAAKYLTGYVDALQKGWSPDNRRPQAAAEELARIEQDAVRFLSEQIDREAKGPLVILPDGRKVPRLPGYSLWMWDGEFCGTISFRWQSGTTELPPYCLGHVGYSVVAWKRRRGYATRALQLLLPQAFAEGLPYLEVVTDFENILSSKQEKYLDSMIKAYEKKTTVQIAVITIDTSMISRKEFENYVYRIANGWGVGQKQKNNGVTIGLSKGYRFMRIENGYGIQNILTDNETKKIIDSAFIPYFKKGEYFEGIVNGLEAIMKKLSNL